VEVGYSFLGDREKLITTKKFPSHIKYCNYGCLRLSQSGSILIIDYIMTDHIKCLSMQFLCQLKSNSDDASLSFSSKDLPCRPKNFLFSSN
jgi:hypothetical protein